MSRRIVFGQPWIGDEEIDLVTQTLRSGWIGQGPLVERFEGELAEYVHASEVVAVNSCSAALHLSLVTAGIGPGDEVITTPFTFIATINAIERVGATPVLADVDIATALLTPESAEKAITPATRAIMPVSFGGRPLDLEGFLDLADTHNLWIVEDGAHAVGAIVDGLPVGADRHERLLTCFSFYPNKNLASAEGGAVCLADADLGRRIRSLRLHGLDVDAWKRYHTNAFHPSLAVDDGFKYNWTDVQAAIALPQLHRLEGFLAVREFLSAEYDRLLADVDGATPIERGEPTLGWRHALHLLQVRVPGDNRNSIVHRLREEGAGAAVHYIAVDHHPRFESLQGSYPNSDVLSHELVSLPLHPGLGVEDVAFVVERLAAAIAA